jgi:hypothetical protein
VIKLVRMTSFIHDIKYSLGYWMIMNDGNIILGQGHNPKEGVMTILTDSLGVPTGCTVSGYTPGGVVDSIFNAATAEAVAPAPAVEAAAPTREEFNSSHPNGGCFTTDFYAEVTA